MSQTILVVKDEHTLRDVLLRGLRRGRRHRSRAGRRSRPAPGHLRHLRRIRHRPARERQGVPVLADRAYQGAGPWVTTGRRRPPGGQPSPTRRTVNRAPATSRAPVERGMALL